MKLEPNQIVWCVDAAAGMLMPSGPVGGSWVVTNPDHVVALVVCLGLLFRRTVQRRHFGLPTDNDGGAAREYLWGWVVALFGGACLLVGVAGIVARRDHHGGASLRSDSVVVVG